MPDKTEESLPTAMTKKAFLGLPPIQLQVVGAPKAGSPKMIAVDEQILKGSRPHCQKASQLFFLAAQSLLLCTFYT